MTSFRRKVRLIKAINDLNNTTGVSDFIAEKTTEKKPLKKIPGENASDAFNVLSEFCSPGENIQTVGYFAKRAEDLGADIAKEIPAVIISDSNEKSKGDEINLSECHLSSFKKKLTGLGMPESGKNGNWTVKDDLTITKNKDVQSEVPMHIVQVSSPKINPSSVNTEVCVIAMNSLPTIEMAKAIPYLNVEFLSSETTKQSLGRGTIKGLTTSRYLLGANAESNKAYHDFIEAPFLTKEASENEAQNTYASMDIFTAPQTMVPIGSLDENKNFQDPFRPFMSVDNFSVTVASPQYGMDSLACSVTANISLILHDRKRLDDIAPLVTPGGFARGDLIRITYGYAHPDGNTIESISSAEKTNMLYGHVIDGMRRSELFTVSAADFRIQDAGEVKIEITALSIGSDSTIGSIDITSAFGDSIAFVDVQKQLSSIQGMIANLNRKEKFAKINTPTLLSSNGTLSIKEVPWKTYSELVQFKKKLAKKANEASEKDALKIIDEVFNKVFNRDKGALKTAVSARNAQLKKIFDFLENKPDPFLVARPKGMLKVKNNNVGYDSGVLQKRLSKKDFGVTLDWISLGKLLTTVVGAAIKKEYQGSVVDEIQMLFHGFNDSAGGVQDMNIASMPLSFKEVKKVIKKEFERRSSLSLTSFMTIINENFIHDDASPAYGIANLPNKKTKEDGLRKVYGLADDYPRPDFKTPELRVSTRLFPGTSDGKTSDKTILRIEFYDTRAGAGSVFKRLIDASSQGAVFYPLVRQTDAQYPTSMQHKKHSSEAEKALDPFLEKIDAISNPPPNIKKLAEALSTYGHFIKLTKKNVKSVMMSGFPSIVYGGAHTGIQEATIASRKDPMAIELAIARQNTRRRALGKEDSSGEDETVAEVYPVECELRTFGCPHFNFGQEFFIDFGTGTNIDNMYTVADVSHTVNAGEFTSTVKLIQGESYPSLSPEESSLTKVIEAIAASKKS